MCHNTRPLPLQARYIANGPCPLFFIHTDPDEFPPPPRDGSAVSSPLSPQLYTRTAYTIYTDCFHVEIHQSNDQIKHEICIRAAHIYVPFPYNAVNSSQFEINIVPIARDLSSKSPAVKTGLSVKPRSA